MRNVNCSAASFSTCDPGSRTHRPSHHFTHFQRLNTTAHPLGFPKSAATDAAACSDRVDDVGGRIEERAQPAGLGIGAGEQRQPRPQGNHRDMLRGILPSACTSSEVVWATRSLTRLPSWHRIRDDRARDRQRPAARTRSHRTCRLAFDRKPRSGSRSATFSSPPWFGALAVADRHLTYRTWTACRQTFLSSWKHQALELEDQARCRA
jgi:hypothetical protein